MAERPTLGPSAPRPAGRGPFCLEWSRNGSRVGAGVVGFRVESGLASSGTHSHFIISPKTPILYFNNNNLRSQHTGCRSGLCELPPPRALPTLPSAPGDEPASQRRAKEWKEPLGPQWYSGAGLPPPPPVSLWD